MSPLTRREREIGKAMRAVPEPKHIVVQCRACGGPVERINGAWLRHRREQAGLSLRSFARQVQYSAPYISDIERNYRNCTAKLQVLYERL